MKNIVLTLALFFFSADTWAQATFKAGWDTYKTGMITHEYTYTYSYNDSFRLYLADSSTTLASQDSAVVVVINYPLNAKTYNKTINYFNAKKQVLKTEEYKGDNLLMVHEWKYDDKNRKNYYYEDDKVNGRNYRKAYDYSTDKKSGELVITESSYSNGKIEFYTKSYYDRQLVKNKEVRLNDNNKDIIHIETYTYGDDGRLLERKVYFPEFKVTKKFAEPGADDPPICLKTFPLSGNKIYLPGKAIYLRNFLNKIRPLLSNPECINYEYRYSNFINDIIISTTKVTSGSKVVFRYKERPQQ